MSKKSGKLVDDVEVGKKNVKGSTAPLGSEKGKKPKLKPKVITKGGHGVKPGKGWKGK